MRNIRKASALLLILVMSVIMLSACSSGKSNNTDNENSANTVNTTNTASANSDVDRIKKAGKLVMLTNAAFPPFEYLGNDNKPAGVDVDIANEIAKSLGVELEIVNMDFGGINAALNTGKGDMGVAGMTVTPDREKNVDFTVKYAKSSQMIIVQKDNTSITKGTDLEGKLVGAQEGTTGDLYVTDNSKAKRVELYKSAIEASAALLNGKIDAVVVDKLTAKSIVAQNSGLKLLGITLTEEEYAIAVNKGSDLKEEINKVLNKLKADGTIDKLVLKHTVQ